MQILKDRPREGKIKLITESADDVWDISRVLKPGDQLRMSTERKVSVSEKKQVRKPMTLTIEVVDTKFEDGNLRVNGTIQEGPEDWISYGDHHGMTIDSDSTLEIIKDWSAIDKSRLKKAASENSNSVLIVVFDREKATFAQVNKRGYEVIKELKGEVQKKQLDSEHQSFWPALAQAIKEVDERKKFDSVVVAAPGFWTEYLTKNLDSGIMKKVTVANCSNTGEPGVQEVLKRPELVNALKASRVSLEKAMVQEVLDGISNDKATYGEDHVLEAANNGQLEKLMISNKYLDEHREKAEELVRAAESTSAEVHILEHTAAEIDSLGGVAGTLRWTS